MIAKNEAATIAWALESAREHVDTMIVLDTGSTDETRAIAAACGAMVQDFAWCDDFAAARNAALDHSEADWNLILDADEWMEGDLAALGPDTLAPLPAAPFLGQVQVASQIVQGDGQSLSRAWITRILPRGVRYEGRIHEQPVSPLPVARLPLTIGHAGYLPGALARKAGRNEALLMRELEARPSDAYLWYQLAREYQVAEQAAQAGLCFSEALRLCPADAPFRHGLVVRALTGLKTAERFDEAVALAAAELPNWPDSPDVYFAAGDLYLELASQHPEQALEDLLPAAELAWKRCLEIGERDDLDGSVAGRGSHMAAHNLAVLYRTFGQADLAAQYEALAISLR
jgi:tetratricopeptide (TPR) repeat protein